MKTVALYSSLLRMHHLQPLGLCEELSVDLFPLDTLFGPLCYMHLFKLLIATCNTPKNIVLSPIEVFIQDFEPYRSG